MRMSIFMFVLRQRENLHLQWSCAVLKPSLSVDRIKCVVALEYLKGCYLQSTVSVIVYPVLYFKVEAVTTTLFRT